MFHVHNLWEYLAEPIERPGGARWLGRSNLEDGGWQITIDAARVDRDQLPESGGFAITPNDGLVD